MFLLKTKTKLWEHYYFLSHSQLHHLQFTVALLDEWLISYCYLLTSEFHKLITKTMTKQEKLIRLEKKLQKQERQIISWACGINILNTIDEYDELKKQLTK